MALIVTKRDRNLLIRSHVTEDPKWFKDLLEENETIPESFLEELGEDKKTFLKTMVKMYALQATKEWTADNEGGLPAEDLGDERTICSLCGNSDNRYVYYVVNRINGERMNVGSSCKEEFGFQLSGDGRTDKSLMKDAIRLRAETELNIVFPSISSIIQWWDNELDKFPVLIPNTLAKPYIEYGKDAKKLFEQYLNRKASKEECVPRMKDLFSVRDDLIHQMKEYSDDKMKSGSLFIPIQRIVNWLRNNNQLSVIERLKEEGTIKAGTIHKICEPNFMRTILPKLKEILTEKGVELVSVNEDQKGYLGKFKNIDIFVSHEKLLNECAGQVLNIPFTLCDDKKVLSIFKIQPVESSVYAIMDIFKGVLIKNGLKLYQGKDEDDSYGDDLTSWQGFSIKNDRLAFQEGDYVYELSLIKFLRFIWPFVFTVSNDKTITIYLKEFLKTGKRQTLERFEESLQLRKSISRQARKDFI